METKVTDLTEALNILNVLGIIWKTVNRIDHGMWTRGIAFFGRNKGRVAFWNEIENVLTIEKDLPDGVKVFVLNKPINHLTKFAA